ncbi:hypothetical protein V5O48_019166, partial [Marasmius crinis-equi]
CNAICPPDVIFTPNKEESEMLNLALDEFKKLQTAKGTYITAIERLNGTRKVAASTAKKNPSLYWTSKQTYEAQQAKWDGLMRDLQPHFDMFFMQTNNRPMSPQDRADRNDALIGHIIPELTVPEPPKPIHVRANGHVANAGRVANVLPPAPSANREPPPAPVSGSARALPSNGHRDAPSKEKRRLLDVLDEYELDILPVKRHRTQAIVQPRQPQPFPVVRTPSPVPGPSSDPISPTKTLVPSSDDEGDESNISTDFMGNLNSSQTIVYISSDEEDSKEDNGGRDEEGSEFWLSDGDGQKFFMGPLKKAKDKGKGKGKAIAKDNGKGKGKAF